jgi:quercetin dioxygenase-like cupin family protein
MDTMMDAARARRTVRWMDTVYEIKIGARESGGIVGLFEATVPAAGGPPVHIHHKEDEVIHVLEGDYEFWIDGQTGPVHAGDSVFLPRGVPHTFRVLGERPGRNLTILVPGGLEEFFVEAAAADLRDPTQMAAVAALAARYGIEFRGPADWAGR